MNVFICILASVLVVLLSQTSASGATKQSTYHAGDSVSVALGDLHPTQSEIGYRQVLYKMNRYRHDRHKLFDDFCESEGAGKVDHFSATSNIQQADSFECSDAVGTHPEAMKTVAIGPDNKLYLTDGHHTFSAYEGIAGVHAKVYVRVQENYSDLPSMAAFWQQMEQQHLVWLGSTKGNIAPAQLPQHIGLDTMGNNDFRSLVYFARDAAYIKGHTPPPFLEFYWAAWLSQKLSLKDYALDTQHGYSEAVAKVAQLITQAPDHQTLAGPYSAAQLGKLPRVDVSELHKLNGPYGKLTYAFYH